MSFLKYLLDNLKFLVLVLLIMGFVNAVFLLDNSSHLSESNLIYIDLFSAITIFCFFILDFTKKRKIIQQLNSQEYGILHNIPEHLNNEQKVFVDFLKQIYNRSQTEKLKMVSENREFIEFIDQWVHQIKSPIAVIELLLENRENFGDRELLSLSEEIDKITENVEKALYYSKIDSFNKDYLIEEFDVLKVVKKVIKDNSKTFIAGNISLTIGEFSLIVNSDKKWLRYIISQIITNSLKYMGTKGKLEVYATENDREEILNFKDNGCGIKNADIPRIFEKGFTGFNGRNNAESTGIGLYLASRLSKKLGLRLSAESAFADYTILRIHFPKLHDYFNVTEM